MNVKDKYIQKYKKLHRNPKRFLGYSLKRHIDGVCEMIDLYNPNSLLDYGSGKGYQYLTRRLHERWGGILPFCYDPGVPALSEKPTGTFDGVICTDVLEHVPHETVFETLEEIFSYANKFVFLAICTRPSAKTFADGENCHITVKSDKWWDKQIDLVSEIYPKIDYRVHYYE